VEGEPIVKEIRDREQLHAYLQEHQIQAIFPEPLMPYVSLYSFEQGEMICSQGETPEYLYVLVKGKVKIYTNSSDGRTLILSFKKPLEVIGDLEYVQGIDFINTVEAVSSVCMIGVHVRWLKKYGRDHIPLLQFLLEIITKKFHVKSNSMSLNIMYPVDVRLASYLLSLSLDELNNSSIRVNIRDTANLIGTSYRHLNRVITQFCDEGWIERNNGFILVKNQKGLRELAGDNIYE
jgi:CRP-like cAMP-binding protein